MLSLCSPVWLALTIYKAACRRNLRYLRQRLGIFTSSDLPPAGQSSLWFHCVSVGEVNAALHLASPLQKKHPETPLVFTTATTTAAELLRKRLGNNVYHAYAPIDSLLMWANFLNKISPTCLFVMETELWLNLFRLCRRREIPLFLINARFSDKKIIRGEILLRYYRDCLNCATHIFARSAEDEKQYRRLGASADKISVIPNLKRSARFPNNLPNLIKRPYLLAASTHKGEDEIVMEAFHLSEASSLLLVIAPRHPQRGKKIRSLAVSLGYTVALRSNGESHAGKRLYIADTIGELPALIKHATMVFTGGSLVPRGGQNVLEPAILGSPQVTGPHTYNFLSEIATIEKCAGLLRASTSDELREVFSKSVREPDPYREMANRTKNYFHNLADPAQTYLKELEKFGI